MGTQTQAYCYSPDGSVEGWYYEDQIPEGYLRSNPKALEEEKAKEEAEAAEREQARKDFVEAAKAEGRAEVKAEMESKPNKTAKK